VQFVAAFDVDGKKVGVDLADAILASENNTIKIADVPPTGVTVQRGHTLDGLGKYYLETIEQSPAEPVDVVLTELHVHQTRDRGLRISVLIVLDALDQRCGTVTYADDCNTNRI
ncbi:MAG: inositol-3-phosphate synthase, partial [Arthrobacter sp.]|nr:inositol-3-phosphate synthase [Arthrobacter sp.]